MITILEYLWVTNLALLADLWRFGLLTLDTPRGACLFLADVPATRLMRHSAYKRVGRRVRQVIYE